MAYRPSKLYRPAFNSHFNLKMMKKQYIVLSLFILTLMISCKKYVTIPGPKNQILTNQVFADSADATSAIFGIYINSMSGFYGFNDGAITIFPGLSADELNITANNVEYNQYYTDNILTGNNTNNGLWSEAYTEIYAANACISGITGSAGISSVTKNHLIAEARFLRAFEYFYLVNLYGAVPLVLNTDYTQTDRLARAGTGAVYAQIILDLQYAERNLPAYSGTNTRPTAPTASALLAKVYLYTQQYSLAETEASKIINSGNFMLEPDLNNVFLNTSRETIWQMATVIQGRATFEGYIFIPSSTTAVPSYPLTTTLQNSFEAGDERKVDWLGQDTVNSTVYAYPYKYKQSLTSGTVNEYEVILRLADVYLIGAEAAYQLGDYSNALADINMIRKRAGLSAFSSSNSTIIFQTIQHERQIEFCFEWGNRWLDLKRWNLANTVLSQSKPNWNSNDQLYPVPQAQINTNPALTQNPGY
jgi:starch-binding outer membrane protein, SusD/RagB family